MRISEHSKKSFGLLTFIGLLAGILLMLNALSQGLWTRVDLTDGQVYSLSPSTLGILRGLRNPVRMVAYMNRDLPAPYNQQVQFVRDKLEDYESYGHGNVRYEFVDPGAGSEQEEAARQAGCPSLQLESRDVDRIGLQKVYMCLAFSYEDKSDVMPAVTNLTGLEYEITSRIKMLTQERKVKIAILQGHGIPSTFDPSAMLGQEAQGQAELAQLREALGQLYDVITIDITRSDERAKLADVAALLIPGPSERFTDAERFAIDQFLMRGGAVGFFLDRVSANLMTFQGQTVSTGLEEMVARYGVTIGENLVFDRMNQRIMVMQRAGPIQYRVPMPYPPIPLIANVPGFEAFDAEHVVSMKLNQASFPFVSALTLDAALTSVAEDPGAGQSVVPGGPRRQATVLARSSPMSWLQSGFYILNPTQVPQKPSANDTRSGPFPLAVAVTGVFPSYFADQLGRSDAERPEFLPADPGDVRTESADTARILVVGDGEFLQNQYLGANADFMFNAVSWLANDDSLNRIRTKSFRPRPVDPSVLEEGNSTLFLIKYGNIAGVTLAFLAFGLIRWTVREQRRRRIARDFFGTTPRAEATPAADRTEKNEKADKPADTAPKGSA